MTTERPPPLAARLSGGSGGPLLGARAKTHAPTLVEVYGALGFDFVWLDFEHGGPSPWDATVFENLTRAADAAGVDPLVRVPTGDPPLLRRVLDAGVRTVLVPRVETAAEAREAVRAGRFVHDGDPGERGYAGARANRWGADDDREYLARADEEVLVGVQIETAAGLENLEAVLGVPDLGFVFVGPGDLSVSLGHPMETDHPEVREAVARVREGCHDAGVPVGYTVSSTAAAEEAIDAGFDLVRVGDEVSAVRSELGDRLRTLHDR